jgi:hypothetical protein
MFQKRVVFAMSREKTTEGFVFPEIDTFQLTISLSLKWISTRQPKDLNSQGMDM